MIKQQIIDMFLKYLDGIQNYKPFIKYDIEHDNNTGSDGIIVMNLTNGYRDLLYVFFGKEKIKTYLILNGQRCELISLYVNNNEQNVNNYYTKIISNFKMWEQGIEKREYLYNILLNQKNIFYLENPEENSTIEINPVEDSGFFEYCFYMVKNNKKIKISYINNNLFKLSSDYQTDITFNDPIVINDKLLELH